MHNKTLALIGTALVTTLAMGTAQAGKQTSYTDYARVTHVTPVFTVVTIQEPRRYCEVVEPEHRYRRKARSHKRKSRSKERYFISGSSYGETPDDNGTYISSGKSRNGNVTLSGSRISSDLDDYDDGEHRKRHKRKNNWHNDKSRYHSHRKHDRRRSYERCYTKTVSREERRRDGYNVTYVYQGEAFQTRTHQHPGQRIRVRVQIKPH